jgi:D-alanine-D-alanine ligase
MNIEIVTTPNKDLKESGFGSLKACTSVLESLRKSGYSANLSVCQNMDDLDEIAEKKPDLVVLAVKYISQDNEADIWLSEYFALRGINFTGSSRDVLKFDSNKVLAKSLLKNKGIKTANYFLAVPGEYKCQSELPFTFPLFLKPLDAANGNGIDDASFVTSFAEFESKTLSLHNLFNLPVLVEEYLDGPEFTVSIIKSQSGELSISPVEIAPPESTNGLRILGEQAKRDDTEELKIIEDHDVKARVSKLAVDAFNLLGARDFGRVDIKSNKDGECFFMEANLVPGMTYGSSYFSKACEVGSDLSYDMVLKLILERALSRVPSVTPSSWSSMVAPVPLEPNA